MSKSNKAANFSTSKEKNKSFYDYYWSHNDIETGLKNNILIQGKIRINRFNSRNAYITDIKTDCDYLLSGVQDRNRALNNDIVAVKVKEKHDWKLLDEFRAEALRIIGEYECLNKKHPDSIIADVKNLNLNEEKKENTPRELINLAPSNFSNPELLDKLNDDWFERTASVVGIIEKKNNRLAVGHLTEPKERSQNYIIFMPNDLCIPKIRIKLEDVNDEVLKIEEFFNNPKAFLNNIFVVKITHQPLNTYDVFGQLVKSIGVKGDINSETEALLIENGVNYSEFDKNVNNCLPKLPWSIPEQEFKLRRDLRDLCVFTIDPESAKDLDDALHIIKINNELYEVGVHIADVSYFVAEDSLIDTNAKERSTSVYLVHKVIPMLPKILSERLCSLNPHIDRLTFSVIWKIKPTGEIVDEWIGRTIINSVAKLSYEHAQRFIDNPNGTFDNKDFPEIRENFSVNEIKTSVLELNNIAKKLRKTRFKNGSLKLEQPKLNFVLDKTTSLPVMVNLYEQKDSNMLVEEFMLLANIATAKKIYSVYATKALLKRHPKPKAKQIENLENLIRSYDYDCDFTTSGSLESFLQKIEKEECENFLPMITLIIKIMKSAEFFCSGTSLAQDESYFIHYGLSIPIYTNFTSPIRRYSDVIVHRLLASIIDQNEVQLDSKYFEQMADNCNDKKSSARVCSQKSTDMFFAFYLKEHGPLEEPGCVIGIRENSMDILLVNLGITRKVYYDVHKIEKDSINYEKNGLKPKVSWYWQKSEEHAERVMQTVELFSKVNVQVVKNSKCPLEFNILILHPSKKLNNQHLLKTKNEKYTQRVQSNVYNQQLDFDPCGCD